jgi:RNA polymerase sigma factor (sigma-70 family)
MGSPNENLNTIMLGDFQQKIKDGNKQAYNDLILSAGNRLERMAKKMLEGFPSIPRSLVDTDDVFQNALIRLCRALESTDLPSTRDFYNLAASLIRRELIDLYRQYKHKARSIESTFPTSNQSSAGWQPPAPREDHGEQEELCKFHELVEKLPTDEREVISLIYYHQWKHHQVADLLSIDVRTVNRRMNRALLKLRRVLPQSPGSTPIPDEPE